MIAASDVEFHPPDADKPNWAETNFFGFYNAERRLNIGVYALFRTNLRTVNSTICMNSGFAATPWEADYVDYQSVLPMTKDCRLSDFSLGNGLKIRCLDPNMKWEILFDDGEGTSINVLYESIMPPFDIHDPDMDPMIGAMAGKFAWGTAYNGHFDQTGRFTGSATLRGDKIPIDCVSTMDHSWGPRPERGAPNMTWLHAHFSQDLAIHGIFSFDPRENGTRLALTHGYVVEKGQVFGLKAGVGKTVRTRDRYATTVELVLTDRSDREWKLNAEGLTSFPWQCWANMVAFNVLGRWQMNGQVGYGEIQDFFELPQLTRLNADQGTRISWNV
jgi:hypothetical protein